MAEIYYSEDHEWLAVEGSTAKVGITPYAAEQLGDIVFVELPDAGRNVKQQDEVAVVESVKTASEIYAPVSGTITANNEALEDTPETVNEDAQGAGWFFEMTLSNPEELASLMNKSAYDEFVKGL
ncbi:MAG: glycine cleavage system protein GcvH [Robiginitomaculum sp.]|nr:glycine cleavage system protein GcvH [Robiginitomaculum sp.]